MLSPRSFTVLHIKFRSVTHFVFVKGVKSLSSFCLFVFACGCPVVPALFIDKTVFAPLISFAPLSKIS